MQIGVCEQVLGTLTMTRLWASITLLAMFVYPQPIISASAASLSLSIAMPGIFWQSKADVSGGQRVLNAYQSQLSNVIVEDVVGVVERLLPDDVDGSRHQRFIVRMKSGHTVLVVHNIDLAPRVRGLREGDRVSVKGEYEWNDRGGLIHWTHKDPRSAHEDGWIDQDSVRYE